MADKNTNQTGQTTSSSDDNALVVDKNSKQQSESDGLSPVLIVPDGRKNFSLPAPSSPPAVSSPESKVLKLQPPTSAPAASQVAKPTIIKTEKTKPVVSVQPLINPQHQSPAPEKVFTPIPMEHSAPTRPAPPIQAALAPSPSPEQKAKPESAPSPSPEQKAKPEPAPLLAAAQSKQAVRAIIKAAQPKQNTGSKTPTSHYVSASKQGVALPAAKVAPAAPVNPSVPVAQPVSAVVAPVKGEVPVLPVSPNPNTSSPPAAPARQNFFGKLFKRKEQTPEEVAKTKADKSAVERIHTAEELYKKGLASIKDLIAPSSLETHYSYLNLSGTLVRSFFVYSYPRYLDTNWLSPIINFDATFEFSQFIYPISSEEIMKILRKKVAQIQSSITIDTERGNVRDPALATALEDAEQLRTEIQRGQEKFFQFGMYFTVYAEDEKKLDAITKQFEGMLGGKLVLTKRADLQGEHAFNSTLPLCLDELENHRNMNTSPLSTTFPFISSDLTSEDGILYGLNRHNDSLVIFDRFKLPNANSVVFASSGAGKSYAVKLEILRMMMMGTDVIIIDPENEYEALTNSVGGSYLRVSLNAEQRINPFDLPQPFDDQDMHPGDLLRSNIITISGLLKLMLGKMTDTEEALVEKALLETYAVKGITMDTENPGAVVPPTMEDFHSVLTGMKGAENVAQRLQKYTTGTFAGIFNKSTNVNLDNGLVTFCIRDLEDQLRPIAMYILLNYIWNRVRSKLKKRVLVLDEAWTMMQHADAAKFLYGLVKRARKYYLGITAITQDVEDFLSSPYGRPVVTNSALQFLFKQSPSSMEVLQQTFNLTDGEKYLLLNSGVGQGLFFAGRNHVAIQVIASYSEHQLVTTDPEEILAQKAKQEVGFEG